MRWRLLAVALAGFSAALAACNFDKAFEKYCGFPGRCAELADAGLTKIAQGTMGRSVTLTGVHLGDAAVVTTVPDVGTVSGVTSQGDKEISMVLNLNHGVPEGDQFKLRVVWVTDRASYEFQDSDPFVVTAIHVADGGYDDARGDGTDDRPYATLAFAGQKSGPGDTIRLGPGPFGTIFPDATTPCDDSTFKLAPGVTVEGVPDGSTSIIGTGDPGTCAFPLSSTDQVVQHLTIAGFPTGILSTGAVYDGGSRPRVTDVKIVSCDTGALVMPESSLLLQQVNIIDAGFGLTTVGGDVRFEVGSVANSFRNGVSQYGDGGALLLFMMDIRNNGATFSSFTDGAGVLLAAKEAHTTIEKTIIEGNGYTDVTVSGAGSAVTFLDAGLQGFQTYGLALVGATSNPSITMTGTQIKSPAYGIRTESFARFNGGDGDAGGGGNEIGDCMSLNIDDVRTSPGATMTFKGTTLESGIPSAGTIINSSNGGPYKIQFGSPQNKIECY